jgi:hypothetical protein
MAVEGFGPFFYQIVKMNYPKMKNTKALFPLKKESNINHFEVEVQTIGDRPSLPIWSRFLKTF